MMPPDTPFTKRRHVVLDRAYQPPDTAQHCDRCGTVLAQPGVHFPHGPVIEVRPRSFTHEGAMFGGCKDAVDCA